MKNRDLIACTVGNALEYYDYILYAYFVEIFAKLYFPTQNAFTSLLLGLGIFASGFLMRPLGGLVIGSMGDKYGRKTALIVTMSAMTCGTLLMAILPTYQSIGIAAPILLTLVRLLQGLAVSGEFNSSSIYLIEQNQAQKGFYGSLISVSATGGICLGAFVVFLMNAFFDTTLIAAGLWRIPFILAAGVGIIFISIRANMSESLPRHANSQRNQRQILAKLLSQHWCSVLAVIGLVSILALANYLLFVFFYLHISTVGHLSASLNSLINFIAILLSILLIIGYGKLSDRRDPEYIFMGGAAGLLIFAYPIFQLLVSANVLLVFTAQFLFVNFLAMIAASYPSIIAEQFPIEFRNSGTGISYNISLSLFGGTAPLISMALADYFRSSSAPAYYLILVSTLSLITMLLMKSRKISEEVITV